MIVKSSSQNLTTLGQRTKPTANGMRLLKDVRVLHGMTKAHGIRPELPNKIKQIGVNQSRRKQVIIQSVQMTAMIITSFLVVIKAPIIATMISRWVVSMAKSAIDVHQTITMIATVADQWTIKTDIVIDSTMGEITITRNHTFRTFMIAENLMEEMGLVVILTILINQQLSPTNPGDMTNPMTNH